MERQERFFKKYQPKLCDKTVNIQIQPVKKKERQRSKKAKDLLNTSEKKKNGRAPGEYAIPYREQCVKNGKGYPIRNNASKKILYMKKGQRNNLQSRVLCPSKKCQAQTDSLKALERLRKNYSTIHKFSEMEKLGLSNGSGLSSSSVARMLAVHT